MSVPRRIFVAMSGGVDSSVAAALLQKEGYEAVGVTLRLQDCSKAQATKSCCGVDGLTRARAVADQLSIKHYVLDCVGKFEEKVLFPAWEEYARGRTPSPCLLCNERIKFGYLLEWALSLGVPEVATGHYARIGRDADGTPTLLRGVDKDKDQSYFLSGLTSDQLRSIRFPLGGMTKPEVRALAAGMGLPCAETPESQDACLLEDDLPFAEMLRRRFNAPAQGGDVLDESGKVLGRHEGLHLFTVGQRKGIPVQSTSRTFVKTIAGDSGSVTVVHDEGALDSKCLQAGGIVWLKPPQGTETIRCSVQVRYRSAPVDCAVQTLPEGRAKVDLASPVRAITPGQAAVFYDGEQVLGRGWIDAAF